MHRLTALLKVSPQIRPAFIVNFGSTNMGRGPARVPSDVPFEWMPS